MPDILSLLKKAQPPRIPLGPLITLPNAPQLPTLTTPSQSKGPEANITLPTPPQLEPTDRGTDNWQPVIPEPTDQGTYEGPKQPQIAEMSPVRILELIGNWAEGSLGQPSRVSSDNWFAKQGLQTQSQRSPEIARLIEELRRPEFEDAYAKGLKNIEIKPEKEMAHPLLGGKAASGYYLPSRPTVVIGAHVLDKDMPDTILRQIIMHELSHHIDELGIISENDAVDWMSAVADDLSIPRRGSGVYAGFRDDPEGTFSSGYAKDLFRTQKQRGASNQAAGREDFADFAASWILADPKQRAAFAQAFPNRTALLEMHLKDILASTTPRKAPTGSQPTAGDEPPPDPFPTLYQAKFEEHPLENGTLHAATMTFAVPPTEEELKQVQQSLAEQNGWKPVRIAPLDSTEKQYYFTFSAAQAKQNTPPMQLFRSGREDRGSFAEQTPHGVYYSIVDDPDTFRSPHIKEGDEPYWRTSDAQNPLVLDDIRIKHDRFLGSEGQVSAGVAALKKLLSEDKFNSVADLDKDELVNVLNKEFPGPQYDRYYDSYELLEVYGAQLARQKGYDALILRDEEDPIFSEYVALTNKSTK